MLSQLSTLLPTLPASVKYLYKKNSYNSFYKANTIENDFHYFLKVQLLEMAKLSVDLEIDYPFILYVLFAIAVCSTAPVYFYNRSKYFAGFASLILFILIFVFYGMRWFSGSTMAGPAAGYKGAWPPQISVCPDYLTYYKSGTTEGCYNATGSKLGELDSLTNLPTSSDITSSTKTFNHIYTSSMKRDQLGPLCQHAKTAKLSWEGITNSESCTF